MSKIKEFVSFAKTLNDAYKLKYNKKSHLLRQTIIPTNIKVITKFSLETDINHIMLPLTCSGRLITAGEYFDSSVGEDVILSEEELKKSIGLWNVPIMKSHAASDSMINGFDVGIDHIVGQVRADIWNEDEKGIDWEGIIADEDLARKIALGLIKYGSVTFTRNIMRKDDDRLYYIDIEPIDFSLVFSPKDKSASVKAGGL